MKRFILSLISVMILITVCVAMTSSERQDKYVAVFHPAAVKTQDVAEEFFGKEEIIPEEPVVKEPVVEEPKVYDGVVYLTFDDGPVEAITVPILDILKEYGVKATFFTLGSYGERNPEILKRQAEEGHTVANHSYSHKKDIFQSLSTFQSEIEKTNEVILNATGKEVKFFRIPYGTKVGAAYKEYLDSLGMEVIGWNCESYDSRTPKRTAEQILEGVKSTSKGKKEVIVIMHDTYGKTETVKALPSVIEYFQSINYEFKAF
ncbi:MAG: polysaccharide deacetylase [Clostridia bacterium]|nr:polysaccharide deacetylase [Clostridia bacterium]